MQVTRASLLDGKTLQIGTFAARPASDACGDVESGVAPQASAHAVGAEMAKIVAQLAPRVDQRRLDGALVAFTTVR
jgi:hypothetical protein